MFLIILLVSVLKTSSFKDWLLFSKYDKNKLTCPLSDQYIGPV